MSTSGWGGSSGPPTSTPGCRPSTSRAGGSAAALLGLAYVHYHLSEHQPAIEHYRDALDLACQTGNRFAEAEAHTGLVDSLRGHAEHDSALTHARLALGLARTAGYRMLEGSALTATSAVHLTEHRPHRAADAAEQALAVHRETGHRIGEREPSCCSATP